MSVTDSTSAFLSNDDVSGSLGGDPLRAPATALSGEPALSSLLAHWK